MKLFSIEGNTQRLDGGAMFGNCPRVVWEKWAPPDEKHRIRLASRALLVRESSGKHVLFEAGIGAFFSPKLRERYGVEQAEHVLVASLAEVGVRPEDINVVVLSHLHFDHAGGVLDVYREGAPPKLVFPRARYIVGEEAWRRAKAPHMRDRASFIPELPELLEQSGRLVLAKEGECRELGGAYRFVRSDGHTPGMLLSHIDAGDGRSITFLADLIPGVAWVHVPITMGYDRYPERLIDEKRDLYSTLARAGEWAFFTHDPLVSAARIASEDGERFVTAERLEKLLWS